MKSKATSAFFSHTMSMWLWSTTVGLPTIEGVAFLYITMLPAVSFL